MSANRSTQKERLAAEADFAAGVSIREISEKYKQKMRTVRNWHERYGWRGKRKDFQRRIREAKAVKMVDVIVEDCEQLLHSSSLSNQIILEIASEAYKNRQSKTARTDTEMIELALVLGKIAQMAAKVLNDVQPRAQEDVFARIMGEIEELKERLNDDEDAE